MQIIRRWRRSLPVLVGCALASACGNSSVSPGNDYSSTSAPSPASQSRPSVSSLSAALADFLGDAYYHGWVTHRDTREAAHWYYAAAVRGDVDAERKLGFLYFSGMYTGLSGPKALQQSNPGLAAVWWRKAAMRGNAGAQWFLGTLYQHGEGVKKSYKEALHWYELAAASKSGLVAELAQFTVASVYAAGDVGIPPNYDKAALWYRKAAENYGASMGFAQCKLADLYERGEGVARSYTSAYLLYDLAEKYNCPWAESNLKALSAKISSLQLARARMLAATWKVGSPLP